MLPVISNRFRCKICNEPGFVFIRVVKTETDFDLKCVCMRCRCGYIIPQVGKHIPQLAETQKSFTDLETIIDEIVFRGDRVFSLAPCVCKKCGKPSFSYLLGDLHTKTIIYTCQFCIGDQVEYPIKDDKIIEILLLLAMSGYTIGNFEIFVNLDAFYHLHLIEKKQKH